MSDNTRPVSGDEFVNAEMLESIMEKVIRLDDRCWYWTGAKTQFGYGIINRGCNGKRYNIYTHRAMYILAHGPVPDGYVVQQTCDNSSCCNPAHLKLAKFGEERKPARMHTPRLPATARR